MDGITATLYRMRPGDVRKCSIPNIIGVVKGAETENSDLFASGAFSSNSKYNATDKVGSASGWQSKGIDFDASRSNAAYSKSTTVQPAAFQTLIIIRT